MNTVNSTLFKAPFQQSKHLSFIRQKPEMTNMDNTEEVLINNNQNFVSSFPGFSAHEERNFSRSVLLTLALFTAAEPNHALAAI